MTVTLTTGADPDGLLDEVLASYLEAIRQGQAPSRQALLEAYPQLAPELGAFFADQDRLDCLVAPLRAARPAPAAQRAGQVVGEYEILEEIARGGMGVVYKAHQRHANRIVALKMLRGAHATAADLRRFRAEVEAVAALDHPNIVPIYDVGEQEGQPYFSMKLLEGGSLAATGGSGQGPVGSKDRQLRAARLVATVARAVHHAHQRGILHRDLKPSNVLVDAQGQPHVTDFGLAKRLGQETALTETGAVLGTPSYMAPEQASQCRQAVTTAVDIYSLGAILYELLTDRPPFRGQSPLETMLQVQEGQLVRPRALCPRLSRDLETICLKCLEKEPGRRYPSAADLAEDLDRFVAGEPIRARPPGPAGRLWRWCRRRPVVAGLALALLVSLAGGLAAALWQGHEAEVNLVEATFQSKRAEENYRQAQQNFQHAEERFLLAHRAVNDFCGRVEAELAATPGLQAVRRRLLRDALAYYNEFLRQRGNDPGLQAELADTFHRIAWITAEVGSKAEALAAHQQTLAIYQSLTKADPNNRGFQSKLASAYHNVALLQADTGHPREAESAYEQAAVLMKALVQQQPGDAELRYFLANSYNNLANLYRRSGQRPRALQLHREARMLRAQLVREQPKNPRFRNALAHSLHNLAVAHEGAGDFARALELAREALALRERLTRDYPRDARWQGDLALSYHTVGVMNERVGARPAALEAYDKARSVRETLARANPGVTGYQLALAACYTTTGIAHGGNGDHAKALASHRQAEDILQRLARSDSSYVGVQRDLGRCCFNIGVEANEINRPTEALAAYQRALTVQEKLVRADPVNLDYRQALSQTLGNLGLTYTRLKRHREAREALARAITQARVPFEKAPGLAVHRGELCGRYRALAEAEQIAGRPDAAAAALRAAAKLSAGNGPALARLGTWMARLAADAGRARGVPPDAAHAAARRLEDEALALLAQARNAGYKDFSQLRSNRDLERLRQREEFGKLFQGLPR
jgi:tetratricopeptide (TPR) repeat protein